ncbi:MAG TPA: hypothetical protein PLF81_03555 [Candidatus Anammoximicrobium sp.]|nr:hypothetical protein [Candidatus Anammoximicrobium sp.]
MTAKEPVLLTVLIETASLRWYVAGIGLEGEPLPLLKSEAGNLSPYLGLPFDEQVSFLRHRLSGVLQRGCDRLWGRQKKPCHIVFVADGPFAQAAPQLTGRVAEHFVEWMTRPPVAFFICVNGFVADGMPSLQAVAGELNDQLRQSLDAGLPPLWDVLDQQQAWETFA